MIKPISSNHDPNYKVILTTRNMQTLYFPSQKRLEHLPRPNRKAWRLEQVRVYDNCLPFPSFEGFKTRDLGLRFASLLECLEACESQNPPLRNLASITVRKSLSYRCNLAYQAKCSLRNIHMASSDKSDSRGALIVLEGLDRCGKTSQCGRLHTYLEETGNAVELWRFPDRNTGVGQMISSYLANQSNLDDRAIHLLFSANRWEKRSLMESKLRSGTTLIVDRYSFSGVAFSSAKGLDVDWCKAPDVGLLAPDVVVYLDITPEKAAERGGYGGERYEKLEFQKTVAQSYKMLRDSTWQIVDATLPIEDVEKQLRQIVMESVRACQQGKPFSQLWRN